MKARTRPSMCVRACLESGQGYVTISATIITLPTVCAVWASLAVTFIMQIQNVRFPLHLLLIVFLLSIHLGSNPWRKQGCLDL